MRRKNGFEPNFRWTKPSVSLANEANYSDGHCYAYTYKMLKIGPLVGMPVPGTCTFAGWESLPDGVRWGVPGVGVKDSTHRQVPREPADRARHQAHERIRRRHHRQGPAARGGGGRVDETREVGFVGPALQHGRGVYAATRT